MEARVGVSAVINAGWLGGAIPVPGTRKAYFPVNNENRVGVQVDAEQ